jgi:predicted nucleic acid-binding protein
MSRVFADTSYYVALMGERDQHHAAAVALAEAFFGEIITTDFVLTEVGNWLSRTADRPIFLSLLELLGADPQTTVLPASRELFDAGRAMFARRMDKDWSLTDCVSFTVMNNHRLAEALTADHHFEQAGFRRLLR